jgi:hypothetical protein
MISGHTGSPLSKILNYTSKIAWGLFLVFLPITSFPFFPSILGGNALVRPLSLYPLLVLLILVTLPRLFSQPVPKTLITLLPFAFIAIASSLLSTLRGVDPVLGISVEARILRGLITLGMGGAIYFTVSLMPRSLDDLRASLRWLYAGFGIALFWGSLQAVYVLRFTRPYFQLLLKIQEYVSTRRLFTNRVTGITYEPNWFAEQISLLLLPWLLASVLSGYSVFRWRWRWLSVEWFLLGWSVIILVLTFSRTGLINLMALAFIGLLFFRPQRSIQIKKNQTKFKIWFRRLTEAGIVLAILVAMIFLTGTKNTFFSRMWGYFTEAKNANISDYFEYIGFSARFAYGEAAYRTYEAYPTLGVGVGNYALYFQEMLPDEPIATTPELLRLVTPEAGRNRLITPKNFYFRILAETGLVGAAAFTAYLAAILGCALFLWVVPEKEHKFWGKAGLLGLFAFALTAFSFDSFAIPNMWVVFGLITSAAWIFYRLDFPAELSTTTNLSQETS